MGLNRAYSLGDLPRKVKAYDVKEKKKVNEFETIKAAANFYGISASTVRSCIKLRSRNKTNNSGTVITFR